MESPINMDDLGVHPFQETDKCIPVNGTAGIVLAGICRNFFVRLRPRECEAAELSCADFTHTEVLGAVAFHGIPQIGK